MLIVLKEKLNIISFNQVLGLFKVIPALVYAFFLRITRKEEIWLFSERRGEARDNAAALFEYVSKNKKHISAYYAIETTSADYERLKEFKNRIIEFGTVKHYAIYFACKAIISSQKHNGPSELITFLMRLLNINNHKVIFLGHGITKDNADWLHYDNSRFRLFCCGAYTEYQYVKKEFGYPKDYVCFTGGLCRYDLFNSKDSKDLKSISNKEDVVLILPTWRNWLVKGDPKMRLIEKTDDFRSSLYFEAWTSFIKSEYLQRIAQKYKVTFVFYPHPVMQRYIEDFETDSENVIIANQEKFKLGELINNAKLLITDYSSVYFDFIYQNKPILFYQFDYLNYRQYQYREGYFDYTNNNVGKAFDAREPLLQELENIVREHYTVSSEYIAESNKHFPVKDKSNCERTYNAIYQAIYKKD